MAVAHDSRIVMPPPLIPGARISLVAPASPFALDRFQAGLDILRAWEFEPIYDQAVAERKHRYLAGDDPARARELIAALRNGTTDAVMVIRGGYGMTRLLPALTGSDAAALVARPKWIIGFSDITALHGWCLARGVASMHGPMAASIAGEPEPVRERVREILTGRTPSEIFSGLTILAGEARGPMSGPLLGGNLTLLAATRGTIYAPKIDNAIVLIEEIGEAPYRIDRMLTQLSQTGLFSAARAVIFGNFSKCEPPDDAHYSFVETLSSLATEIADRHGVVVMGGAPFGHESPNFPWIHGARAILDPAAGTLSYAP